MRISITIDVPEIEEGLQFYRDALGLSEIARPIPTYVTLACGDVHIGLIEKPGGTAPAKGSADVRRYQRHWTPIHLDIHVDDFGGAVAKALSAGAKCEQRFAVDGRPPIAFCSDPFGHGFCIVGPLQEKPS